MSHVKAQEKVHRLGPTGWKLALRYEADSGCVLAKVETLVPGETATASNYRVPVLVRVALPRARPSVLAWVPKEHEALEPSLAREQTLDVAEQWSFERSCGFLGPAKDIFRP